MTTEMIPQKLQRSCSYCREGRGHWSLSGSFERKSWTGGSEIESGPIE
jgi:hypothetical protein